MPLQSNSTLNSASNKMHMDKNHSLTSLNEGTLIVKKKNRKAEKELSNQSSPQLENIIMHIEQAELITYIDSRLTLDELKAIYKRTKLFLSALKSNIKRQKEEKIALSKGYVDTEPKPLQDFGI